MSAALRRGPAPHSRLDSRASAEARRRYQEADAEARRLDAIAADGRATGEREARDGSPCCPLAPPRLSAPADVATWADAYLAGWRACRG